MLTIFLFLFLWFSGTNTHSPFLDSGCLAEQTPATDPAVGGQSFDSGISGKQAQDVRCDGAEGAVACGMEELQHGQETEEGDLVEDKPYTQPPRLSLVTKEDPGGDIEELADDDSDEDDDTDTDTDTDSEYLSFDEDNDDNGKYLEATQEERMARERERQMVLEAAGLLIVQQGEAPPPPPKRRVLTKAKSTGFQPPSRKRSGDASKAATDLSLYPAGMTQLSNDDDKQEGGSNLGVHKRRPAPATPVRRRPKRMNSENKDLPPLPTHEDAPVLPMDHAAQLDDAFARYETFKNAQLMQQQQASNNRLSVISTDSSMMTGYSSPTSSFTLVSAGGGGGSPSRVDVTTPTPGSGAKDASSGEHTHSRRHSHFLSFLRSKTPEPESGGGAGSSGLVGGKLQISAPMVLGSHLTGGGGLGVGGGSNGETLRSPSNISLPISPLLTGDGRLRVDTGELAVPSREPSPGFGTVSLCQLLCFLADCFVPCWLLLLGRSRGRAWSTRLPWRVSLSMRGRGKRRSLSSSIQKWRMSGTCS